MSTVLPDRRRTDADLPTLDAAASSQQNGSPQETRPPAESNGRHPEPGCALERRAGHPVRRPASVWSIERALVRRLLAVIGRPAVSIVLWNGEEFRASATPVRGRLIVRDRRTFWRILREPTYQFGEAYMHGRAEIEGDVLEIVTELQARVRDVRESGGPISRALRRRHRPQETSLRKARENIHHHYDIGNDFYRLWLDEQLVYTCAYFAEPHFTLEEAQTAKLDHVCRKLQLRPGQNVIEAGCGWGALALHMARHYGVMVRAFNISKEQLAYARRQAHDQGLADRVEFVEDDWRNIAGACDAFVSVGMLEHVGRENYRELGRVIQGTLRPEGRGLIHSIGQNRPRPFDPWTERRIFPGAYPPSLAEMADIFEPNGLSVLDIENLRLHYAETCRHWLVRYTQNEEAVRRMFDEPFVRAWRLYLAASSAAFTVGNLQLFQIAFAHGACNNVPMTRTHLYES